MTTTRALTVPANGGSAVLAVQHVDVPDPGPGQAQVKVAAAGVNFIDVYQRQGVYPIPTPFTLGMEGAGEVVAVGEGVDDVAVGDRVAWAMHQGTSAGLANIAAAQLIPVPDGLDFKVAAAAALQGMTAHYLVNSTYAVQPGDVALVHAAAGGVGQLLVQMITAKGGTVIATAGGPEKLAIAERLGASTLIDYRSEDVAAAARAATDGTGVHVAYDGVGKDTFDASLASLRPRGMVVLFGGASGQVPPFDLQRLNAAGSAYVTRPSLAHYLLTRDELLWRGREVFAALADGSLELEVGGEWPLEEAAAAYDALEGRQSTGKLLLTP
ncbi:Quinone oxidoreductase [Nostocoides australiense Ben110]|uniref:Quinone oxidoreductase n=1 Tax=Nostocoides australiense Ben110 TaxID=1193182 RepID=W6K1E3_9MICO|nr:quinone oxidoreductase [Tetrasphaera australiensis]MCA0292027.1 quinone oxidoreductase [Actinomycetota bacterium]CCH75728.1 Quinone oxidoreductase [Tetrasphaera australiensis Ben110]HRW02805.1 quinone oxidoreductase [Tetrasphaera sp.]